MDIPIMFFAPMVRALLEGRKTMTRRLAWRNGRAIEGANLRLGHKIERQKFFPASPWQRVKPGDRLWVRETIVPSSCGFDYDAGGDDEIELADLTNEQIEFWNKRAGVKPDNSPKVSPIHMPRWASRLTLIVTATKIERLQEISEEDAKFEGAVLDPLAERKFGYPQTYYAAFADLWETIHGSNTWDANPEVVALTFTVHKINIDALPKAEVA